MERERAHDGFVKVDVDLESGHEIVVTTASIAVLIYIVSQEKIVLVTQERKPMVGKVNESGEMLEAPAGRFDHEVGIKALAVKEVMQETGITIGEDQVYLINRGNSLATTPGTNTELMYLACAEITPEQLGPEQEFYGAAEEGERTRRVIIDLKTLDSMIHHDMKTFALIQWFLRQIEYPVRVKECPIKR